ncbi:MAG: DUF4831 family protein [Alistipes sp.]|nr:DUF4831 family protein [Alistipes sp.]
MKKIFAILALVGIATTAFAQNTIKAGLYDKQGNAVVAEAEPVVVNVTLRVDTEHFKPGVYARYAQKYLGKRATLSEYSTVELVDGRLALGVAEKVAPKLEQEPYTLPLPLNRVSATVQTTEEQAAATAEMIFSLRRHRLDLITGEAGENVFGAGLKAALEEIARMEKECLDMFYGAKTTSETVHTFNIAITPDKNEYMVCRFSDKAGVVEVDDLSGMPIVVKVETEKHKEYPQLQPLGPKDKVSAEYLIVPQSKCSLVGETTLMDTLEFASPLYGKSVVALPIK